MLRHFALASFFTIAFFLPVSGTIDPTQQQTILQDGRVHALYDSIVRANRFVEKLDSSSFYNLPVGFTAGNDNDPSYALIINKATLKPGGGTFNAYMSLTNPLDSTRLAFEAQNVPFSFKGGLTGTVRLVMVTEKKIPICKDVDLFFMQGSYVEWDCNGFSRLKIKGRVEFASSTFLPADENGKLKADGSKLTAYIETEVKSLNDLALTISLSPFQMSSVPGLTFSCKNLVIDHSDYTNPDAIKFPVGYLSSFPSGNESTWRGIYIGDASVILGPEFQWKKSNAPTSFSVKDLIIDEKGLTGAFTAKNILPLDQGNLGGWEFSVSTISVKLLASKINEASFGGQIHIPALKQNSNLSYAATIDVEGKYNFIVSPSDSLVFPLFGSSRLTLYKNSSINITIANHKFLPVALLTGNISINAPFSKDNEKNNLKLTKVEFQDMRFSTVDPVFDVKYIGVSGLNQGAFASFPITIDKIALRTTESQARLSIGLVVNLMNSDSEGFGGSTILTLVADRDGFNFHYKGIEIEKIKIDIEKGDAFALHGSIMFAKDDPVYGNGFRGELDARFGSNINIKAIALFGKVKDMRYFFVDAMFCMKPGIQAGPLTFYGFGGGLYWHMKQRPGVIDPNSFGASRSGLVYAPNDSIGIGIMAEVKFGVVNEKLIDADVKFEVVFNSSSGLNYIGFFGGAKCVVPGIEVDMEKSKAAAQKLAGTGHLDFNPTDAAIGVTVSMEMDFVKHSFHAELEAFLNVGIVLQGIGPQGSMGKCVMHIAPDKWYLHMGTPTNPMGIKLLQMIQVSGYFMAGDDIPTSLLIPPTVASILKITPEKACTGRNDEDLSLGKGIAFGSAFSISTGDLQFLCFYGKFEVGMGYDMMMISYPKDYYCQGHSAPMGINGWYAKGQAYAYLNGEIGLKVKVFRKEKKFEILSIGAAALLIAEGPNPMYVEGQAGGRYSVLGGMVKGECKFKVTYGEKCVVMKPSKSSPVQDLEMIASVTPQQDAQDVDLFAIPQAVFNVPVNKIMNISDDDGSSHKFRANLEKCLLKLGEQVVTGTTEWNLDNNVIVYKPYDILNPNAKYNFDVEVSFDEWKDNKWETVTDNGAKITEKKNCIFTTGALPKEIPLNRISYCYPVMRQYNFYPQEYNQGYIAFNIGLTPFFNLGSDWKQQARFTPVSGGKVLSSDLVYNSSTRTVTFAIPSNLAGNKIYRLELTNIPLNNNIARNVSEKTNKVDLENDSNKMEVKTREAAGTLTRAEEITFLKYGFRASKYKTMTEKLSFTETTVNMLYEITPYVYHLQSTIEGDEMFDKFEIYGTNNNPSLIRRTAILDETPWYKSFVEPVIYKNYPLLTQADITWRNATILGVPPSGEIKIWQLNYDHILTDEELETGVATAITDWAHFMYGLPYNWSHDYSDIRMKLANLYPTLEHSDPQVNAILKKVIWPVVDKGSYPVKFEYVLPGINKVTSSKTFIVKNPYHMAQPSL